MIKYVQSWGRYPNYKQSFRALYWRDDIVKNLSVLHKQKSTTLAYGNGRSYGDSCLAASDFVLHTISLDRFIKVDWEHGIVIAEAGITLAEILEVAIPQGWFLPVTPGTKYVTLGAGISK